MGLRNDGLHVLYCSPGIYSGEQIKRDEMGLWHIWVEKKATYRSFMGKSEGKRPLGRYRNILLKWIFKKQHGETWNGLIGTRNGLL
jgi:hypothetical protein